MTTKPIFIPTVKIGFDRISFYESYQGINKLRNYDSNNARIEKVNDQGSSNNNNDRSHAGELSLTAKQNLLRAIERFVFYTNRINNKKKNLKLKGKRSLKFITLTLSSSQIHSDVEIKKTALNQFLVELRKRYDMQHYVWKAEKQKNGNIHFHLIVDVYIHYSAIREIWNRCQNRLGYVDRFRERMLSLGRQGYIDVFIFQQPDKNKNEIIAQWNKLESADFKNPPSTEIKQVEKVRKTKNYFAKYLGKESNLEPGFGRIWFASRSLTKDISLKVEFSGFRNYLIKELENLYPDRKREYEYSTVFWVPYNELENMVNHKWLEWYTQELDEYSKQFW